MISLNDDFTESRTVWIASVLLLGDTALRGVYEILMKTDADVGSTIASNSLVKLSDFPRTSRHLRNLRISFVQSLLKYLSSSILIYWLKREIYMYFSNIETKRSIYG